jgi:hypothetical protein
MPSAAENRVLKTKLRLFMESPDQPKVRTTFSLRTWKSAWLEKFPTTDAEYQAEQLEIGPSTYCGG